MANVQKLPKAIANGSEKIRGVKLVGAVLDDLYRTRVFSENSLSKAFGFIGSGHYWRNRREGTALLPAYLSNIKVREFIDSELEKLLGTALSYLSTSDKVSTGLPAAILPRICDVFIKAAKKYPDNPSIVKASEAAYEIIMAFSQYGVTRWVDKMTGYKYEDEDYVIQQQLALYVAPEILDWRKEFQTDFYKEIFRLKGWPYNPYTVNRPGVVGTYTNQYVYSFLPSDVFKSIKNRTPKSEAGNYTVRLHQSLNNKTGKEALRNQLVSVTTLLKISKSWEEFKQNFQRLYGQMALEFEEPRMELIVAKPKENLLPESNTKDSEFVKNIRKGLNWNPKEHKQ